MHKQPASPQHDIEVQIGPHPSRPNSRIMRVTYAADPDHDARVTAALDALFGPRPARGPKGQAEPTSSCPHDGASSETGATS